MTEEFRLIEKDFHDEWAFFHFFSKREYASEEEYLDALEPFIIYI